MTAPSRSERAGGGRIRAAFEAARDDGRTALVPYVVAGYPDAETSYEAALACIDGGADVLEVGLPYSDPLADGATLQRASGAALPRLLAGTEGSGVPYPADALVVLGFSGRGDKDLASFGRWRERSGRAASEEARA